jgi:nucleoside-diphosphate-sugar epimerase
MAVMAGGPVAVTGADGFVGRALWAHLRAVGMPLRGLVRTLSGASATRPDQFPVGDLTAVSDAALANALHGVGAVVHLAGRAHVVRETEADPLSAFRAINVVATERIARAAAAAGARHFVFASSVKVNGESTLAGHALREGDPPDPRDDYAASKWEAECALADVARATGMRVTILRLPLLVGPGVKGNVARLTDAVERGFPLPLAGIDNRRSLLGAGNLASAIVVLLASSTPAARTAATYFLADAAPVSTPELVRSIAAALRVEPRLMRVPLALLRAFGACTGRASAIDRLAGSLVVDAHAFEAAFGWQPSRTLAEELEEMVRARHLSSPATL